MSSVYLVFPAVKPPLPLMTFLQTSYPSLVRPPSFAVEPVRDREAPRVRTPDPPAAPFCSGAFFDPHPVATSSTAASAVPANICLFMDVPPRTRGCLGGR